MSSLVQGHVLVRRGVAGAVAVLAASGLVLGGAFSASAATPAFVAQADVATTPSAAGGWWQELDDGHTGGFAVTTDSFDGSSAAKLTLPSTASGANLHDVYSTDSRPTDLPALLSGAGYTYTGTDVNFQIQLVFDPTDAQYSATGTSACTSAKAWGFTDSPTACYALLKWEPLADQTGWATVDLSADTAANSSSSPQTGGWVVQSKRVGAIAPSGALVGHPLSEYLAQMSDYQVVSFGFGAGSGAAAGSIGWVKSVVFGGQQYAFGAAPSTPIPDPPAPAPAASDAALDQLIADQHIDVAATSRTFSLDGGAPGSGLDSVDPSTPISGSLPWTATGDDFVDVYAYSSPVYLGTFPVVNGQVVLTGLDIGALEAGGHHLVFQGQTSGTVAVVAITVQVLASTGANAMPYVIAALVLLLLGVVALVTARLVRQGRRRHGA